MCTPELSVKPDIGCRRGCDTTSGAEFSQGQLLNQPIYIKADVIRHADCADPYEVMNRRTDESILLKLRVVAFPSVKPVQVSMRRRDPFVDGSATGYW